MQDAHNLAWKLAAVLRGLVSTSLLDTYETERRPIAQDNLEHMCATTRDERFDAVAGLDNRRLRALRRVQSASFPLAAMARGSGPGDSRGQACDRKTGGADQDGPRAMPCGPGFKPCCRARCRIIAALASTSVLLIGQGR